MWTEKKSFNRTVIGVEFKDDWSVPCIIPFVTVHMYSTNIEQKKWCNRCGGRELGMKSFLVGTAVLRGIMDVFVETFVGDWNGDCHEEQFDSSIE